MNGDDLLASIMFWGILLGLPLAIYLTLRKKRG